MLCKTIILSNSQNLNNNPKGILTLSNENNRITGKIRLYNINTLPLSTKIGLYLDEKVYISTINKKPNHYEFVLEQNLDITKCVYCALIDTANNKQVLLEGGSFNGFYFTDSPFDAVLEAKDPELEKQITQALQDDPDCGGCNCENCEYKRYFYDNYATKSNKDNLTTENLEAVYGTNDINQQIIADESTINLNEDQSQSSEIELDYDNKTAFQESVVQMLENELEDDLKSSTLSSTYNNQSFSDTDINLNTSLQNDNDILKDKDLNQREKLEFLNDIVYQLDEMFLRYPEDSSITDIIPNSKFVLVDGDNPYVLGAIYEDNIMKYIAYGVPAKYNSLPPSDLGNHYQWLPLNPRDSMSDGYFMIYQNAATGSIVEINFE